MMDELDLKKLWRVSFDNLNFKLKYSKDIKGEGGPKRALNLLTGQVAYTQDEGSTQVNKIPSLKELTKAKLKTFVHPQHMSKTDLHESNFQISESENDYYHHVLIKLCTNV